MKFSIRYFFSKCYQTLMKLQIWSHLLKISSIENFIFCAVTNWGPEFFVIYWPESFVIFYKDLQFFVILSQVAVAWKGFVTNKIFTLKRIFQFQEGLLFILYIPFRQNTASMTSFWKRCVLIIYLLTYLFCFSFCNWHYLEKNFYLLNVYVIFCK